MQNLELPDLSLGVDFVQLLEIEVYFNEQYLSSQEPRPHYSATDNWSYYLAEYCHNQSLSNRL